MHYLTRHLEALREFSHGDQHLRIGDDFFATDVDADYLLQHKRVKEVADQQHYEAVPPVAPVLSQLAEATQAETSTPVANADAPTEVTAPEEDAAEEPTAKQQEHQTEEPQTDVPARTRRAYTRRAK